MLPENLNEISTNMSSDQLKKVANALQNDRDNITWGYGSLYEGSGMQKFTWEGVEYEMYEYYEVVTSLYVVKYW